MVSLVNFLIYLNVTYQLFFFFFEALLSTTLSRFLSDLKVSGTSGCLFLHWGLREGTSLHSPKSFWK